MGLTRVAYPGTISPGDTIGATNNNHIPGGMIGRDSNTTNATTTTTTVVGSCAPTVGSGRLVYIEASGLIQCSAFNNSAAGSNPAYCAVQVTIHEDGVQIQRVQYMLTVTGDAQAFATSAVSNAPSAGSHTYELIIGISGTAGPTITNVASATTPTRLNVFDGSPTF